MSGTGFKRAVAVVAPNYVSHWDAALTKYDGTLLNVGNDALNQFTLEGADLLYVRIANTDSGWGDSYTPTADEIKA